MTTQAQTYSLETFCNELEAYLKTGVLPVRATTWNGVQTFHVQRPTIFVAPQGELKIAGKIVKAPEDFAFMIGQDHSLILALAL